MIDMPGADGQGAGPNDADLIKDVGLDTFAADVIEASMEVPVIVDFWAPWCEPCKQLTPVLEKVVKAAGGAVRLAKVNIDENQSLAQQMRVQSVPTVYAISGGRPVDAFTGALPESQVKAFVEKQAGEIGPSPVDQLIAHGEAALEQGDFSEAAQAFTAVLQHEAGNLAAICGLTHCYIKTGDLELAEQTLQLADPNTQSDPLFSAANAALNLARQSEGVGGDAIALSTIQARINADPKDVEARFELSNILMAEGEREKAVEELLEIVRVDRTWNDEAARKQLLTLFEAFGPTDELTLSGRRSLSSILFS